MRLPRRAREYVRTCANCGYSWTVPRSAARRRVGSISMISTASQGRIDRTELAREVDSISAENQLTDTFRHCPRCDAEQFEQHPWRGQSG